MRIFCVKNTASAILMIFLALLGSLRGQAQDYIIFDITHQLPMTLSTFPMKKDYHINMGGHQGVKKGTLLDVYRLLYLFGPDQNKKRYSYKINLGQLRVIHAEDSSSIARREILNLDIDTPILDINGPMVGDQINVHL